MPRGERQGDKRNFEEPFSITVYLASALALSLLFIMENELIYRFFKI